VTLSCKDINSCDLNLYLEELNIDIDSMVDPKAPRINGLPFRIVKLLGTSLTLLLRVYDEDLQVNILGTMVNHGNIKPIPVVSDPELITIGD
jgi:hypothetical protein